MYIYIPELCIITTIEPINIFTTSYTFVCVVKILKIYF